MIISVTERQLFKRCRRRWDFSSYNRQALSPIINAPALELGTLIHATLAKWTDDAALDPNEIYLQLANETLNRIISSYEERIGCRPSKDEMMPTFDAIALGKAMIQNYHTHWKSPLPPGYTLVQNEQTFTTPIPNTYVCGCEIVCAHACLPCEVVLKDTGDCLACSSWAVQQQERCPCITDSHYLEATFDGVMADELGQLFIIERKTYSRRPSEDDLDENDQFLAYIWALRQANIGPVRGLSYDGLWKRDHAPAGKQFSDLFLRKTLQRNQQELDEFERLLAYEANEMANPNTPIYKNVPVLGGCWDCSTFRPLCKSMSRNPQHHTDMLMKSYIHATHKTWRHAEVED